MHCDGIIETRLVLRSYNNVVCSAWCRTNDDIDFVPYREHKVLRLQRTS